MRSVSWVLLVAAGLVLVPSVQGLGLASPTAYLVGYQPASKDVALSLVGALGATVTGSIDDLNVLRVVSPLDLRSLLSSAPGIAYVEVDGHVGFDGAQWDGAQWNGAQWNGAQWDANGTTTADPGASQQWGLAAADVPLAEPPSNGVGLCVLDSGVQHDHPDLAANVWTSSNGTHGWNAIDGSANADDDAGHGTHMAGIAAAVRGNGIGIEGVSNASIMSVKVLDSTGHGTVGDLAAGMAWCADHGARVALMALSVDGAPTTITRAIDYLAAHDVVMVASAGNGGPTSGVAFPASDPRVIAVAATDAHDQPATFSAQGAQVALAAPGVSITSTFVNSTYASGSGTSEASAWVAGAAALVRAANPALNAADVRSALTGSARDVGAPGWDPATGAGVLNVTGALAVAATG
jgi:subtilisin family serine protease